MNPIPMKIKSIAPWFGGKRTMADDIVRELGSHVSYFEPFCGSLAVLFYKPQSSHETVNDLHGDVINLARVVQSDHAHQLYDRLQRTLCSEDLFKTAKSKLENEFILRDEVDDGAVDRAHAYFIASWIGRNGVSGTMRYNYQIAVRWTPGGGHGGTRFRNSVDSIPAWHERLRNVLILNRDAFGIIEKIDDVPGTAIYIDPPYFHGTRGSSRYLHDFTDDGGVDDDHARLANALRRFKHARVVISYYDHERIRNLYPGWTVIDHTRQKNLHVQNRRGAGKLDAHEVLIINSRSYATSDGSHNLFDAKGGRS